MPTLSSDGAGSHTNTRRLEAIRAQIVACDKCSRLREYCAAIARTKRRAFLNDTYWGKPVPGHGDPNARVLIVGLAPAAHGANRTGRMFTGDGTGGSGDFLMAALHATGFASLATSQDPADGLVLRDAYVTAAVRCAPPGNRPTPAEVATCVPYLDQEVQALSRLAVIVALGRLAHDAVVGAIARTGARLPSRPRFVHGACYSTSSHLQLIDCYHPSRQNTHTGRLTAPMLVEVFRTARAIIGAAAEA